MLQEINRNYKLRNYPLDIMMKVSYILAIIVISILFTILIYIVNPIYLRLLILIIGILVIIFSLDYIVYYIDPITVKLFDLLMVIRPLDKSSSEYIIYVKTQLEEYLDSGKISIDIYYEMLEDFENQLI